MTKRKTDSPDETQKLGRERRLEILDRICNQRRKRLAFWQKMNLDDPDARAFVEQLECLVEANEALTRRLESNAKLKR